MGFRILADENVAEPVVSALRASNHDVETVAGSSGLQRSASDEALARYAGRNDRLILTSDDDFLTKVDEEVHDGVLFQPDDSRPAGWVASVVDEVAKYVNQDDVEAVVYVTDEWL